MTSSSSGFSEPGFPSLLKTAGSLHQDHQHTSFHFGQIPQMGHFCTGQRWPVLQEDRPNVDCGGVIPLPHVCVAQAALPTMPSHGVCTYRACRVMMVLAYRHCARKLSRDHHVGAGAGGCEHLARISWMRVQQRSADSQRLWPSNTAARLTGWPCSPGSRVLAQESGFRCSKQQCRSCRAGSEVTPLLCALNSSSRGASWTSQSSKISRACKYGEPFPRQPSANKPLQAKWEVTVAHRDRAQD